MKNFAIVTISILALALMPACESSSSDAGTSPGTGFSTGLDGASALSDLTDEQQIAACEAGDAYFEANHDHEVMEKFGCVMAGMMAGMMGTTCQDAYDACIADDPEPVEESDCSSDIDDLSGCTDVTVAELEACVNAEWIVQMEAMATMAAMTCDDIEAAMSDPEGGTMEEPPTPAACEGLEEKCPAFFADDADDM